MELKVACNCGQNYKFDVNPVGNQMPFAVACPSCGTDGTAAANTILSQMPAAPAPAPVLAKPSLSLSAAPAAPAMPAPPPIAAAPRVAMPRPAAKPQAQYSLGMGVLGAFIGSAVGGGIMLAVSIWMGFRFPLLGAGIGFGTGYLARVMARGVDSSLGAIAAVFAVLSTALTLYLIYGVFPIICLISVAVSASAAFRTAS